MARSGRKPRSGAGRARPADNRSQTVAIGILVQHLEHIVGQLNLILRAAREVQGGGRGPHVPTVPTVLVGQLCQDVALLPNIGDPARRRARPKGRTRRLG